MVGDDISKHPILQHKLFSNVNWTGICESWAVDTTYCTTKVQYISEAPMDTSTSLCHLGTCTNLGKKYKKCKAKSVVWYQPKFSMSPRFSLMEHPGSKICHASCSKNRFLKRYADRT